MRTIFAIHFDKLITTKLDGTNQTPTQPKIDTFAYDLPLIDFVNIGNKTK